MKGRIRFLIMRAKEESIRQEKINKDQGNRNESVGHPGIKAWAKKGLCLVPQRESQKVTVPFCLGEAPLS
jgi:hypothetical protein